jgi:signal peptidase I
MMKYSWKSFFKDLRFCLKILGIAILLAIILRLFVFSSFKIPTPSMEPAIIPGDYILVNKLAYGARIPRNLQFMQGGAFETFRVKGFSKVKRNDVIVFNFPYPDWNKLGWDLNLFYLKRCVALPGDTFYIEDGIYKVKNCPDTLGCYPNQLSNQKRLSENKENAERCFPFDEAYNWTVLNFGPLYIPRKGDRLAIDSKNILLYRNLIVYETGKELTVKQDTVYWGGAILRDYVFQQNYYFMTGDYVFDSRDSRYWGLLPEDHIVGKAAIIWQSKDMDTDKRRWERTLKRIRN